MAFLFEYGNWAEVSNKDDLRGMLQAIWKDRLAVNEETDDEDSTEESKYQPFLQFDGNKIRARNHSGFIQRGDELIEIYPKVFRDINCQDKALMLDHVFYWLRYCSKWRFPFTQAGLETKEINSFPEMIIYLIANQIYSTVASQPLAQYQAVEEALITPKGSINFSRYANNSLSKSNFHKIECDYEPFVLDNKVNRIIKYCVRVLLNTTRLSETTRILQEITYILDEVEDSPCKLQDAESISLNSFYEEYTQVINSCKLILSQQLYSNTSYDLSQWCLLLPMEYIFEDFIAGFLEMHFSKKWRVEYQKSDLYFSNDPKVFRLQHDIFLTGKNRKLIIDAKYKIRNQDYKTDPKKGVSQTDLYQMLSYAYKRGCDEAILIYPNISEVNNAPDSFKINSAFDRNLTVNVKAMEIPFWSMDGIDVLEHRLKTTLNQLV